MKDAIIINGKRYETKKAPGDWSYDEICRHCAFKRTCPDMSVDPCGPWHWDVYFIKSVTTKKEK